MDDHTSEPESKDGKSRKGWLISGVFLLGLGSLGPANVYYAATDPRYLDKLTGWRILVLPVGAWLLTGFLIMGLTVLWHGGIKRDPDWAKHIDPAWEWWSKL